MTLVRSLGLLCILLLGFQSLTNAAVFDCCYTYTRKALPKRAVKGYIMQNSAEVCDIDAVILITKKFRVCANPKDKWVTGIVTNLKKKETNSKKSITKIPQALGIFDCCTKHTKQEFKVTKVGMFEGYDRQDSSGVCDIDAIVFTVNTRPCGEPKRIPLCADPKKDWVGKMIIAMKNHAKKSKKKQQKKREKLCKRMKKNYV
ncbi:uncharacterized protein LOC130360963 [Hyla sarda]|uniref:uncharacterized protein LOC130360963 n=1 Tax=Hyla sarda TaxID=327740 RepID=UPI0024C3D404|nr:uncharacterized protein LOC130360963 [Hyla sarda]